MLLLLFGTALVLVTLLAALAWRSSRMSPTVGLTEGRLRAASNGVCSERSMTNPAWVAPFAFADQPADAWERVKGLVEWQGGRIVQASEEYLWATFRASVFRFVDDLELRLDREQRVVHVRSASRVGRSDFGVNRRRVEKLRARFGPR